MPVRVLLIHPSPGDVTGGNVVHRPDLVGASSEAVALAVRSVAPEVVITTALEAVPAGPVVVPAGDDVTQALIGAERACADALPVPITAAEGRSVTLVGAGIVNLISALSLTREGYRVTVYDRAPDPRADAHWTAYGCTRGGGDGRMFTLTEADSYNSRSRNPDGTSNELLTRPVSAHGWGVGVRTDLPETERRWAEEFHRIPPWLADSYTEDIFSMNLAADAGWAGLRRSDPGLFDDGTGYRDGILRLYTDEEYFRWHVARNERVGAVRSVLTPAQVRAGYPALAAACADGTIAGGLEVVGFTVNIHRFLARLVTLLETEGVRFRWAEPVTGIHWSAPGVPDGLDTAAGIVRSDHYVLSPGAYDDRLLRGTLSHGRIQGMLGVWVTVPNVEPLLGHSVKIARKGHRAEETNVTLGVDSSGAPILICGSGYGWTGLDPDNVDQAELEVLFEALEDTVRRFFPGAYAAARDAGTLEASRQVCVRPWTSSCLGVFETMITADGGALLVTGGHNTGGFAQSPVVAEAVLAALAGRPHLMHRRFHPARLERFYSLPAGTSRMITS